MPILARTTYDTRCPQPSRTHIDHTTKCIARGGNALPRPPATDRAHKADHHQFGQAKTKGHFDHLDCRPIGLPAGVRRVSETPAGSG